MNNALKDAVVEALGSGAVARRLEALREELDGLSRVEQAVLACCLGYELAREDFAVLEAMEGADGEAWRWLRDAIGLRVLPDGTPQAWAGETLREDDDGEPDGEPCLATAKTEGGMQ